MTPISRISLPLSIRPRERTLVVRGGAGRRRWPRRCCRSCRWGLLDARDQSASSSSASSMASPVYTLAHLGLAHHHRDGVVRRDLEPAVERRLRGAERQRLGGQQTLARRHHRPADHQRARGTGGARAGAQEGSSTDHALSRFRGGIRRAWGAIRGRCATAAAPRVRPRWPPCFHVDGDNINQRCKHCQHRFGKVRAFESACPLQALRATHPGPEASMNPPASRQGRALPSRRPAAGPAGEAERILQTRGVAEVSLREVARAWACRMPHPIAITRTGTRCWQTWPRALRAPARALRGPAAAPQGGAALRRLRAYLEFAAAEPAIYRLMFGPELRKADHPSSPRRASAPWTQCARRSRRSTSRGRRPPRRWRRGAGARAGLADPRWPHRVRTRRGRAHRPPGPGAAGRGDLHGGPAGAGAATAAAAAPARVGDGGAQPDASPRALWRDAIWSCCAGGTGS